MSQTPAPDPVDEYRMSILDHLRELRTRLIISLWAMGIGIVLCFFFAEYIFAWLVEPMNAALATRGEGTMAITDPLEAVVTYLKVAVLAGFFVASPIVFYQTWQFIGPGLYQSEKRVVLPLVISSTLLFISGAAFGYFVIFRYGFEFFLSLANPENTAAVLSINAYLMTATKLLVAFGASFQLPVVIFFIARMGLIDARDMVVNFRYAIVGSFIVAAIITPPDPLTQTLMAGPLLMLYAISIGVAWMVSTKERPEVEEKQA